MSLRIAMISEHASPLAVLGGRDSGGQNVYVSQLAQHLAATGIEVDIFTRRDRTDLAAIVSWKPGIRVIHVPAGPAAPVCKEQLLPYMDTFASYFIQFCQQQHNQYHVVHAHFWMSGLVAVQAKRILGLPFVVTFHALGKVRRLHQGSNDHFPDERMVIEHQILEHANRVIAECPQDRNDLIQLYDAQPDKLEMIPCGFDTGMFWPIRKPVARAVLGIPEGDPLLLQLGRMVPRKGVDNVLEALALLRSRHKRRARLLIVGGGTPDGDGSTEELRRLADLTQRLGVQDSVTFVGRKDGAILRYYYSAADLFVSTPWYEPFGITPLEAMACGTPVLGARVGGIQYTVRHGVTGVLVPPRDPAALASAMARCLDAPQFMLRMGMEAVRHVREAFAWVQVAQQVQDLYRAVLGELYAGRRVAQKPRSLRRRREDRAASGVSAAPLQAAP